MQNLCSACIKLLYLAKIPWQVVSEPTPVQNSNTNQSTLEWSHLLSSASFHKLQKPDQRGRSRSCCLGGSLVDTNLTRQALQLCHDIICCFSFDHHRRDMACMVCARRHPCSGSFSTQHAVPFEWATCWQRGDARIRMRHCFKNKTKNKAPRDKLDKATVENRGVVQSLPRS